MELTPLTPSQHAAVQGLADTRRIELVPADPARASSFLRQAHTAIADIGNLTQSQNRYSLAYDACHDVGEALLAAYGYRTTNGVGQHAALGAFLAAILDHPPGAAAARRFDQLRRARNHQRYDARPTGAADADVAVATARTLYAAAIAKGVSQ